MKMNRLEMPAIKPYSGFSFFSVWLFSPPAPLPSKSHLDIPNGALAFPAVTFSTCLVTKVSGNKSTVIPPFPRRRESPTPPIIEISRTNSFMYMKCGSKTTFYSVVTVIFLFINV